MVNACDEYSEKLVVWTLLDTGLCLTVFETLKRDILKPIWFSVLPVPARMHVGLANG